jgi:hypothetical protein
MTAMKSDFNEYNPPKTEHPVYKVKGSVPFSKTKLKSFIDLVKDRE